MPKKDSVFSEEYQVGAETEVGEEGVLPTEERAPELEIEAELYGIDKPKRVTVRARIIDD